MMMITRRTLMLATAAAAFAPGRGFAMPPPAIVHKDPDCGCCEGWVDHLRANGFVAKVVDTRTLNRVKARLGVPQDLYSCHTAELGGYVIEGHVPVAAIQKLLAEKPTATGLAAPGMPLGSPGMSGEPEEFDVILFGKGTQRVYGRFKGDKAV
jgi:hypothetical protein